MGIRGRLQVDGSRLIFEPRASETRSLVQNKRPDAVAVQDVDVPVDGANTTDRAVGVRAAIVDRHFASVTLVGRKLLDHRVASPLASLEQDQKLGHLVPALVELADYVGADLAQGREDLEEVAAAGGPEVLNEAADGRPVGVGVGSVRGRPPPLPEPASIRRIVPSVNLSPFPHPARRRCPTPRLAEREPSREVWRRSGTSHPTLRMSAPDELRRRFARPIDGHRSPHRPATRRGHDQRFWSLRDMRELRCADAMHPPGGRAARINRREFLRRCASSAVVPSVAAILEACTGPRTPRSPTGPGNPRSPSTSPATSSAAPTTQAVSIDPSQVATSNFQGFGAQWDCYGAYQESTADPEVEAVVLQRIAFMKLPIVRTRFQVGWYSDRNNLYNFSSPTMTPLYNLLEAAQRNGTTVALTEWQLGSPDPAWTYPDPRYTKAIADGLQHLIRTRGYSNIKFVIEPNEPNILPYATFATWATAKRNLASQMAALRLESLVKIAGPDVGGENTLVDAWLTPAASDLGGILKAYDLHHYPSASAVQEGTEQTVLSDWWGKVKVADPKWTSKTLIQGEAGISDGATDTVAYGVDMTDFAIQSARAGTQIVSAWMLDDESYPLGLGEETEPTWWGMWQKRSDGRNLKPWFYPWSLLCRLVRPGATVYRVLDPPGFRVGAFGNPDGSHVFVFVNRNTSDQAVRLSMTGGGWVKFDRYVVTATANGEADANGFPVPDAAGQAGNIDEGITFTVPADGLVLASIAASG